MLVERCPPEVPGGAALSCPGLVYEMHAVGQQASKLFSKSKPLRTCSHKSAFTTDMLLRYSNVEHRRCPAAQSLDACESTRCTDEPFIPCPHHLYVACNSYRNCDPPGQICAARCLCCISTYTLPANIPRYQSTYSSARSITTCTQNEASTKANAYTKRATSCSANMK